MKKIDLEHIAAYMNEYIYDEDDKKIIHGWFNIKSRKIAGYPEMIKLFGAYNEDLYIRKGWIPMDGIDTFKSQKEFIMDSGRADLIVLIKDLEGMEFDDMISPLFHDNEELHEEWFQMNKKATVNMAKDWLEKNNLPYFVNREMKKYLD